MNKVKHLNMSSYVTLIKNIKYDQIKNIINDYDLHVGMGTSVFDVGRYGMPSLVAIAFVKDSLTLGYVHNLRPYCVGELDEQDRPFSMLSGIRHFMLNEDRQKISSSTVNYIDEYYNTDSIMNLFLDFVSNSKPPRQVSRINLSEIGGLSEFEIARFRIRRDLPWIRKLELAMQSTFRLTLAQE